MRWVGAAAFEPGCWVGELFADAEGPVVAHASFGEQCSEQQQPAWGWRGTAGGARLAHPLSSSWVHTPVMHSRGHMCGCPTRLNIQPCGRGRATGSGSGASRLTASGASPLPAGSKRRPRGSNQAQWRVARCNRRTHVFAGCMPRHATAGRRNRSWPTITPARHTCASTSTAKARGEMSSSISRS